MTFKDLELKARYTSAKHDIVKEFYTPVLSDSKYYCRVSCYFSSSSLSAVATGISNFLKKGETMYLIIGNSVSEEDADALMKGYLKMDDLLLKKWDDCISTTYGNSVLKNRFEALSWLLANDKMKIKIGVNLDNDGKIIPSDISKFHEKIMIFEDSNGNMIHAEGSNNETVSALAPNRESFSVHKSWIQGHKDIIQDAREEFWELWNNKDPASRTFEIPDALYKNIIKYSPKEMPEIDNYERLEKKTIEKRELRKYQSDAIESWERCGYKGILEMATGTGKTFTALKAIERIRTDGLCLIITVPQKELAEQWIGDCRSVFGEDVPLLECRERTGWKTVIKQFVRLSKSRFSIMVTVIDTFVSETFQQSILPIVENIALTSDEVHEMGATKSMGALQELSPIRYRLGLSATPLHYWDTERNDDLTLFFGNVIFSWDMKKAINPPHGYLPCLVPYSYQIKFSCLDEKELDDYCKISNEINKYIARKEKDLKMSFMKIIREDKNLQNLLFKRTAIIQRSKDRLNILKEIITENISILKKCIIYCENIKEIETIRKIVTNMGYDTLIFHSGLKSEERKNALKDFRYGTSRFIIAVGCLDQGVDIPNCDSAIILSSSKNPREYVQRRGRILRPNGKEKTISNIFDVIVFPFSVEWMLSHEEEITNLEKDLIRSQISRLEAFTEESINLGENRRVLIDIKKVIGGDNGRMDGTNAD